MTVTKEPEPSVDDSQSDPGWKTHFWVVAMIVPWMVCVFEIPIAAVAYVPSPDYPPSVIPAIFLSWLVLRDSFFETLVIAVILSVLLFFARSGVDRIRNADSDNAARSHNIAFTQGRGFVVGKSFGFQRQSLR